MQLETKAAFVLDDAGAITATAWVFADADRTGDIITKGAFATAAGPIPMLWAHAQDQVIGVWDAITETAEGLQVRGRLLVETVEKAREVYGLIKAQAVNGVSIGFAIKNFARRSGGGRTISAVDLAEVSIVSVPAHAGARVTSLKSADHAAHQKEPTLEDQNAAPDVSALETKLAGVADEVKNLGGLSARLDAIEKRAARPAAGVEKADDLETKAFASFARRGVERLTADEVKSLNVSTDTAGGYLAPEQFVAELIKNLVQISPLRQAARVTQTAAPSVVLPKRTGTLTAQWVAETAARPASQPAYGQQSIAVHEAAVYVDVSNQLLEDSAINIASELSSDFAEEFGRLEGIAFLSGDAAGKPAGLMLDTTVPVVANGHAANLSADALVKLVYDLPAFYRASGAFLMSNATIATVRLLKDSTGRYLWQESLAAGQPATLLGFPVIEAPDMPGVAANALPIVFGDFARGYRILDRVGLSVLRDPYTMQHQGLVRFHARRRVGGAVVQAEALRFLKMAVS